MPVFLLRKQKKAFSTGEVILAMFVLSVGLLATMALVSKSLKHSFISRDIIIASELAQEGIELVRNVRDNDFARGNNGFGSFDKNLPYCRIDYDDSSSSLDCKNASQSPGNPSGESRYALQYQGGMYAHTGGTRERFSRALYIDYDDSGSATDAHALVRSFVYWGDASPPPNSGDSDGCTQSRSCVFTELYLTSWK